MESREVEHEIAEPGLGLVVCKKVAEIIGLKIYFPDDQDNLQTLVNNLRLIEGLSFSEQELATEFQKQSEPVIISGAKQRLVTHSAMLRASKVLINSQDHETRDWELFNSTHKEFFTDAQELVKDELSDGKLTSKVTIFEDNNTLQEEVEAGLLADIIDLTNEISRLIPEPREVNRKSILGSFLLRVVEGDIRPRAYTFAYPDQYTFKNIYKKVKIFNDYLTSFIHDPAKVAVASYVNKLSDELREVGSNLADNRLAPINTEGIEQRRVSKKAGYAPALKSLTELAATTKPEVVKSVPEKLESVEVEAFEINDVYLDLPWIERGPLDTVLYRRDQAKLLVVDSIQGKLKEISLDARRKSRLNGGGADQYDVMANKVISSFLEGILPHQKNSGFKSVLGILDKSPYKGTPIWYATDISPNAPRFYFTIFNNAQEVTSEVDRQLYDIDSDTVSLVIIGETDKANQVDALKVITGASHKRLRKNGSGSV